MLLEVPEDWSETSAVRVLGRLISKFLCNYKLLLVTHQLTVLSIHKTTPEDDSDLLPVAGKRMRTTVCRVVTRGESSLKIMRVSSSA